jgi:hypothetical protein
MVSEDSTSKVMVLPVRAPQAEHQVEGGLLLDVVVSEGTVVLELLVDEDEPLLVRGAFSLRHLGPMATMMMVGNLSWEGLCEGSNEDDTVYETRAECAYEIRLRATTAGNSRPHLVNLNKNGKRLGARFDNLDKLHEEVDVLGVELLAEVVDGLLHVIR